LKFQPWDNKMGGERYQKFVHAKHRRDFIRGNKMDFLYFKMMAALQGIPYVGSKTKQKDYMKRLTAAERNFKNIMTVQYWNWHNEIH